MAPLRRYRTQLQVGQILLLLGVFLALPVPKPTLWILEVWGGLQLPGWLWPLIFAATGGFLLWTRHPRHAQYGMMLAAVLLWTIAGANYLTLGLNANTLFAGLTGLHAVWTAIDLRARADWEQRGGA